MTPGMQAIAESPIVLALSELGHALPTPMLCPMPEDYTPIVIWRPELFVKVSAS